MQDEQGMRLRDAYERVLRLNEIAALLKQMQLDKERLEKHLSTLKAALAGASLEVYKLETKSASFLDSMFGAPDKRLEMERNNTAVARLRCSRAEKELSDLNQSIEELKAESRRLAGSGEEYESLYEQKKQNLIAEGGDGAQQIIDLIGSINTARTKLKKINGAYKTCERALSYLESSNKELEKAKNWGTADMMGGRFVASAIKHSHIKNAIDDADNAKAILRDISSPAADSDIGADINIKPAGEDRVADIFMDNIVIDMIVQNRIDDSLGNVAASKSKLQSMMCKLMVMEHQVKKDLKDINTKLDSIILA